MRNEEDAKRGRSETRKKRNEEEAKLIMADAVRALACSSAPAGWHAGQGQEFVV